MNIKCDNWSEVSKYDGYCGLKKCNVSGGHCIKVCGRTATTYKEYKEQLKNIHDSGNRKSKKKTKKPTVTQMMLQFAKAMAKWVSKGLPVVSKEKYIERRKICSACYDGRSCPVCGCNLAAKVALETEKCPKDKW